ncbi:MAG: response regulator [Alphaproteobacteria bacterium]|nr:response regulator [Alphaproteobacteria bacterium]
MTDAAPILIVEDNTINMRLFSDLLVALGYTVCKAEDAEQALKLLEDIRPGAIIMDIQLPGMSGVECTQTIRLDPDLANVPIIAVTAFAMAGDEARFLKAGCDDYLSKPISVPVFLETVARHYRLDEA